MHRGHPVDPSSLRAPPASLWLVATGLVVGSFVVITLVTQHQARAIDRMAARIAEVQMPEIDQLTSARGALRRASTAVRLALADGRLSRREPDELDDTAAQLGESWRAYRAMPASAGEAPMRDEAEAAWQGYLKVARRVLDLVNDGDLAGAHALVERRLMPALEAADGALEQLVRQTADHGHDVGEQIRQARQRVGALSYLLHGLAATLALLVLSTVARASTAAQRSADERLRLENERNRLAEDRVADLELFGSRVAHDLKNPLGTASLQIESLKLRLGDRPRDVEQLDRATASMRRASAIIDGIFELARAGGRPEPDARADLRECVASAVADVSGEAERAAAHLEVDALPAVDVACTPGALLSVLLNLLRNAVKYIVQSQSAERSIRVHVEPQGARVRVEVEDNGPGLPPGDAQQLFEPWVRGPSAPGPGLGLGLATVRRIVEAHGGTVGVESQPGRGSRFWFELPTVPRQV
jgi:signal transduction histidine kinase